jgi:serpin B
MAFPSLKKLLSLIALALACAACEPYGGELIKSSKQRLSASAAPAADVQQAALGNADLGFDLYHALRTQEGNLFFSPYSITSALGMAYAGARGDTAIEMADALHFTLPAERLHPSFNAIDLALASRDDNAKAAFKLNVVNALWNQKGQELQAPFLDTLAESYGAGMRLLDFARDAEGARQTINHWVSYHTADRIPDLLQPGALSGDTRLVLTNAIYFNAAWKTAFDKGSTTARDFHRLGGSTSSVQMMRKVLPVRHVDADGYQVVELPYSNADVVLTLVVPDAGQFAQVEAQLSSSFLSTVSTQLVETSLNLGLPRFKIEGAIPLAAKLQALGMRKAFSGAEADFSGITGEKELFVSDVIHKAYVNVTEEGTEAAAATAVVFDRVSAPLTAELTIDRPFLFAIRDVPTGAVLFLGRVVEP